MLKNPTNRLNSVNFRFWYRLNVNRWLHLSTILSWFNWGSKLCYEIFGYLPKLFGLSKYSDDFSSRLLFRVTLPFLLDQLLSLLNCKQYYSIYTVYKHIFSRFLFVYLFFTYISSVVMHVACFSSLVIKFVKFKKKNKSSQVYLDS